MKFAFRFLLFCIGGSFLSCESNRLYQELQDVESLVVNQPDSAASLFNTINPIDVKTDRQKALYAMLRTQLYYLHDSIFTSDSIIASAAGFYEKDEDWPRLVRSNYLWGCVAFQLQEIPKAQRCYLNALDAADKTKQPDPALLGRIYNRCGDLYVRQGAYEDALMMHNNSFILFNSMPDTFALAYVYRDMARVYHLMGVPDSVTHYYKKAADFSDRSGDKRLHFFSKKELASLYLDEGALDSARYYLFESLTYYENRELPLSDYLTLGYYYQLKGNVDSAYYYLNPCLESEDLNISTAAAYYLFYLEKRNRNIPAAFSYLNNYVDLKILLDRSSRREQIVRTQAEYSYEKTERENLTLKLENYKNKVRLYQVCGIVLLVIIAALGLLYLLIRQISKQRTLTRKAEQEKEAIALLYKQKLHEIEENKREVARLTKAIEQGEVLSQARVREIEEQLQHLRSEQQSTLSTLTLLGREVRESAIFLKFHQAGSNHQVEISDSDWLSLQTLIETAYPDFLPRLFTNYNPSQKELKLCLLLKTGLSVSAIADILYCTISSVSATRSRLYTKITGEKGSSHDFDVFLSRI